MKATSVSKLAVLLTVVIAAILVILPFHAFFTTWAGSNFGHLDLFRIWKEILLSLMLPVAVALAWQYPQGRKWLLGSWLVRLFAAYVLLHLILGIWALAAHELNAEAFVYSLIVNLRFIAFLIVCLIVVSANDFLKRHWAKILLLPAAAVVIFGLLQKLVLPLDYLKHFGYGPDTIPAYQTIDNRLQYQRIQSTLRGANPLGAYLVLILSAAVVVLRKNRTLQALMLGLVLMTLFYSYSRSAWIGAAIAVGLLLGWSSKSASKTRALLLAGATLIVVTAGGLYFVRSNSTVQDTFFHTSDLSSSARSSNAVRADALRGGARDIAEEPLGGGPGTAGPASFRNDQPARIAESYYLQIGQEVGVLGLLIFLAINAVVAKQLWRRRDEPLPQVLLASLVGITFINLFSHAWTDDTLSYLWWGLAGIALAPAILPSKHKKNVQTDKSKAQTQTHHSIR